MAHFRVFNGGLVWFDAVPHSSRGVPAVARQRLTWSAPVDGTNILPVRLCSTKEALTPGIYCSQWVYVLDEYGEYCVAHSQRVFERCVAVKNTLLGGSPLYRASPSLDNLRVFRSLPFVEESEVETADSLLHHFGTIIPTYCLMAMEARLATDMCADIAPAVRRWAPGFDGSTLPAGKRRPACFLGQQTTQREVSETVEVEVEMTRDELVRAAMARRLGKPVKRKTKLQTTTSLVPHNKTVPVPAAVFHRFQRYVKSGKTAYSQQLIGAWLIYHAHRVPLLYDPRTGKTLTAIMAAGRFFEERMIDRVLVIAPVGNVYQPWVRDLLQEGYTVAILDGTEEEDAELLARTDVQVYVTNYERVHSRSGLMREAWGDSLRRTFLVCDETNKIKNYMSRRSRATRELSADIEYVTFLNGTAMGQGPHDFWAQMRLTDHWGVIWEPDFQSYRQRWLKQISMTKTCVNPDLTMEFETLISQYSLRVSASEADQFAGKTLANSYVKFMPSREIYDATKDVLNGYLKLTNKDGEDVVEEMTSTIIRTYGFLRRIAAGFGSYRAVEDGPYVHVPFSYDPKLLWIHCKLASDEDTPLVIFLDWRNQEYRLKQMLDDAGIPWSSTAPKPRLVTKIRFKDFLPLEVLRHLRSLNELVFDAAAGPSVHNAMAQLSLFENSAGADIDITGGSIQDCNELLAAYQGRPLRVEREVFDLDYQEELDRLVGRISKLRRLADPIHNDNPNERDAAALKLAELLHRQGELRAIQAVLISQQPRGQRYAREYLIGDVTETYEVLVEQPPYKGDERNRQIERFQQGDTKVFILKWNQGTGLDLHRRECVQAGIGGWPEIVAMAPPWSLGDFKQGLDRCVTQDPRTGKQVCTRVNHLIVNGTIEETILKALQSRQEVADQLLKDIDRCGYESFADAMLSNMESAVAVGEGEEDVTFFDDIDVRARIELGIPPGAKLTERNIREHARAKLGLGVKGFEKYMAEQATEAQRSAWTTLIDRIVK